MQFYGEQKGDTIFFGDKSTKKFGTYWVDGDTGDCLRCCQTWFLSTAVKCSTVPPTGHS